MYEKFVLKDTEEGTIRGYSWHLDDPDRVICIVHGIGEYGGRFDRVAEAFRSAGMAVTALDLRGHGESPGRRGHCAPGNIALDYRARGRLNDHPAAYIISAPWIRLVRPIPAVLYRTVKLISRIAPSMTIGSSIDEGLLGNPDKVKPFNENPMVHNRISLQCAVDGFETGLAMENGTMDDNGRAFGIPTLLMHGGDDRICDVEGSRRVAKRKYTSRARASTMVVRKGLAITAGSAPSRLAAMGSRQPTVLATRVTTNSVRQTTADTRNPTRSKNMSLAKFTDAMVTPHSAATRSSFHSTRRVSRNCTCPREMARMTEVEAWLPQLPPVSMSMGI